MAERPQLIPKILRMFPETTDPLRLSALLQPWTNPHLEQYGEDYAESQSRPTILSNLPPHGLLRGISSLGRLRVTQNMFLKKAIQARYGMVSIMVDPSAFGPNSLGEIIAVIHDLDSRSLSNPVLYSPYRELLATLKQNFEKVRTVVSMGAAITQDAIRRLRLLLGVTNATDALFDKLSPGLPSGASATDLRKLVTPNAVI